MFEKIALAGVNNAEWLRLRKSGIGGSDAGAICGVNPYSSAMKVFRDKTSESVEEQDSEAIRIAMIWKTTWRRDLQRPPG